MRGGLADGANSKRIPKPISIILGLPLPNEIIIWNNQMSLCLLEITLRLLS